MKKYRKFLFLFVIIIAVVLGVFLYTSISKENNVSPEEKSLSEIEYLEKKMVTLLNQLNNIESRNYNLSVSKITENEESSQSQSEGSSDKQNSEESGSGSSGESNKDEQQEGGSNVQSDEEDNEEYTLKEEGILDNNGQIDWEDIKAEVENLYSQIPTITLDLYSLDIAKEDVLGFNQELDNLTISVEEENKENTILSLSKLYEFFPKFVDKTTDNVTYKAVISTKNELFKAYSKLDSGNWDEISQDVTNTINVYSNNLINTNTDANKQYSINKIYIMLNELQNAVKLQDRAIFLIKYENILEEINNL